MNISNGVLKKISFLYIVLPIIVFLLGFLRLYIAIPVTIISLIILYRFLKNQNNKESFYIPKKGLLIMVVIALVWCLFSGIGKFFFQPTYFYDHPIRNTIYRDLIMNPWPVAYDSGIYLCYYMGQWLVPSLFGKAILFMTSNETLAYLIGNIFLYIWCTIGIILIFLWLSKTVKVSTIKKIICLLLMFIFFSGLDVIGEIIQGDFEFEFLLNGFEWWANFDWQYSSFTSLIFWVFNQAIVPIIITLMLYDEDSYEYRGVLLICGLLFGPYPILGLGMFLIIKDLILCIKEKSISLLKRYFSLENILSVIFIFPIICLFFMANAKIAIGDDYSIQRLVIFYDSILAGDTGDIYILFVLLEFLIYVILIYSRKSKNKIDLYILTFFLLLLPLSGSCDFIMRTSIPFLIILFINIQKYLLDEKANKYKKYILYILLSIAALNPLAEFNRGIYQTYKQGFIGSTAGELNILDLEEYYRYNYVSCKDSVFFIALAKENDRNEKDNQE